MATRDKGQFLIFNEAELGLIKQTFADNDALIYSIRKVLLQFPMTLPEKELVKQSVSPAVYAVLKKRIWPDIDPDAPLSQIADYRSILTNDVRSRSEEDLGIIFDAHEIETDYLTQQFEQLRDVDIEVDKPIKLAQLREIKGKATRERIVETRAYLNILGYVDPQLMNIMSLAGMKTETVEETKKRLTRDSNK